ncbi:nickel pincer cofactor biosynthesis protein LarB [Desulfobaculum bizertense]|uniref:PurE domain-containing protein n=1 Tax=Desulfobaculum bizertense DSM 18034 TaxID=1121442 RepID=A0A1T4VIL9_9BACT|nr:nickel pincer cofactor biosynthesis protein LarB [Desulfobaculum bizertense]UIJ37932.1 nickel pincer cofactor biosynthesis protein LarB [Desulfobaculum bizertense]SKA64800.1 hypothetical protein SAMN02745702_00409 [Desulfobaculum bizertense DSM 18034]
MTRDDLFQLFTRLASGAVSPEQALYSFQTQPVEELAQGVTLDTHRLARTGQGEVVYGPGKTIPQLKNCVQGLADAGQPVLVTRLSAAKGEALVEIFPDAVFHEHSGLLTLGFSLELDGPYPHSGECIVVTAGASDMGVALEAYGTACFFGLNCGLVSDVGVAGVHRLTPHIENLSKAKVLIVVAGMDGALPSVLAGLVPTPILGVPSTSGKDNMLGGVSSLMAMLNSCSPGVAAMNIDNGFGAAAFASKLCAK